MKITPEETVFEIDAITGEQQVRELNADEIAHKKLLLASELERQKEIQERENALAKLKELGLTDKEIAVL